MTAVEQAPGYVGTSVRRKEDASLLRGKGTFVDNLTLPGMVYMAVVRSPYPHARINGVSLDAARASEGVVAAYSGADLAGAGDDGGVVEIALETHKDTKDDALVFTAIASRMFERCGKDPSFMRLLHFSALEGHDLSDMFFETYVEYINMLICDYIETRIADGVFRNVNPLYASKAFIGMVVNQIIAQELFGEKKRSKTDREKMIGTFVDVFLNGIKTR